MNGRFTSAYCKIFLCFLFNLLVHDIFCQDLSFPGFAPSVSLTGVVSKKIDLNFLVAEKIRTGTHTIREIKYKQQVLEIYSQALLSYHINKQWQISAGYGFQRNNPFDYNWRNEHRLAQQISFTTHKSTLHFYSRLRFEERWFSYAAAPKQFGTRARYQAGLVKNFNSKIYWQINNEIYVIPSSNRYALLSENWLYTGIGFPIQSLGRLETGFGLNTVVRNANKDKLNLCLFQVNWSYIIPAVKMKTMNPVMHSRHF